jgi:hypothetical protein
MKSQRSAVDTVFQSYLSLAKEDQTAFRLMLRGREEFAEPPAQMPLAAAAPKPPRKPRQSKTAAPEPTPLATAV